MRRRAVLRAATVAAVALLSLDSPRGTPLLASGRDDLTGADALVRVYDHILNARFASAEAEMKRACGPSTGPGAVPSTGLGTGPSNSGPAPEEACDVLAATSTWWRILLDPESRAFDPQFSREVEYAIKRSEAWAAREPQNAEAQFYTGAAYAARVQWRVLRDEKLAAARDGKRIKQALERAIALDPDLDDAYFGIGLYKYYADVAPAAAKVLRFLLMLPGGDKAEGLAQMKRARAEGRLLQGEADYQLQILYLWYERRPDLAVELLQSLRDRYPGNPLFAAQLADVQDRYQHDISASLSTWRDLLDDARADRVNEAPLAEALARIGIARQLEALDETDLALQQLRPVIAAKSARPAGSLAAAYLALGEGEDRLGHHDAAIAAYRLAIETAPAPDPQEIRRRSSDRMRRAPDPARAEAYRLSLEGLRRLEKGDASGAESLLAHSLTIDPRSGVAHYRYGRAALAKKDEPAALAAFEETIHTARDCPAPIAAAAYLAAARLHERLAHTDQAIEYYRAASKWFGGSADTRAAAHRALTRLHAK
jgi:Tetratricopeptide repeat